MERRIAFWDVHDASYEEPVHREEAFYRIKEEEGGDNVGSTGRCELKASWIVPRIILFKDILIVIQEEILWD